MSHKRKGDCDMIGCPQCGVQMTEKKEPRAFNLHFFYGSAKVEVASAEAFILNEETIHAIEKAAYDQLRAALKEAIEALEFYAHTGHYEKRKTLGGTRREAVLTEAGRIARQALKKLKGVLK